MAMMAITTNSSMSVKAPRDQPLAIPRWEFFMMYSPH
jgi:hypothetical protein